MFQLGMARAKTKTELLEATTSQWDVLQALIDSMRPEIESVSLFFGADFDHHEAHWGRDKNLRDVLAHLYAWQKMLFDFVEANQNGTACPFLPPPHTWRTTPALNTQIWEHYQDTPLSEIQEMLTSSHSQILELIESFTDEELFTKKYFPWTGTTSLGSYMVSAAPSHYAWAIKKLRAHQKANKSHPKTPKQKP
ncbi:ClbS/DfsB family four-helix bundle protein [Arcanobacterium pinnipediorum]|uniref:ClbS/DfsB family four-helix bundle protein n=1 Tax=Arcanobacterium pinnipediorum TaxID=1503041 RepID=A0ABY5AIP9_9ACTO|nr:ClbS/DfsB family four-helix bundle protein [Arcanobacterium pinnipediorum]USR79866.1 ClbS/DfsB family four-helix bundle protein [Arcanobacterium pinnipediorum]